MKNVICDICGTAYPETAKNCPICGSSREYALENAAEEFSPETAELLAAEETVAAPRKKNKEIFDFDEVNQVKPGAAVMEEDDFDDEYNSLGCDSEYKLVKRQLTLKEEAKKEEDELEDNEDTSDDMSDDEDSDEDSDN